jgi:hypothetical protein
MHTDSVTKPADRNVTQKKAEKELKYELMHRDTTNVEHGMYDCTSNNWSHRASKERNKENV